MTSTTFSDNTGIHAHCNKNSNAIDEPPSPPPPPPSWDAFTVEYEKRVEPFTSQFAEEMLRPLLFVHDADDDTSPPSCNSNSIIDLPAAVQQQQMQLRLQYQSNININININNRSTSKRRQLLDVGCGTGAVTLLALSHGFDVASTDVSKSMVERTEQRAAAANAAVASTAAAKKTSMTMSDDGNILATKTPTPILFSSEVTEGQDLPNDWSESFDVAVANFSVIFFPQPVEGLKEMMRCLVPGTGVAAFSAWGDVSETPAFRVFPDVAAEVVPELVLSSSNKPRRITGSIDTLTELMKEAGFVDITVVGPVVKTLEVKSPIDYYNRFALTSPPTAAMIAKMEDDDASANASRNASASANATTASTRLEFRNRVMATAKARGGRADGSIALDSTAYIAYGRKPP